VRTDGNENLNDFTISNQVDILFIRFSHIGRVMKITPFRFIITLLSFLALSPVFGQNNPDVNSFPFRLEYRWIVFKGLMNGIETDFVFDTGTNLGMANSRSESSRRISSTGKTMKILDANNEVKNVNLGKTDLIQIGGFEFKNTISLINDMDLLYCMDAYLLGSDIIGQLNWEIDFEKKTISVSKKPFPIQDDDQVFRIGYLDQRPFTSLQIPNLAYDQLTLVDFGYTGILDISKDNKNISYFLKEKEKTGDANNFYRYASGALGSTSFPSTTVLIDSIRLDQFFLPKIPVDFEENTKSKIGIGFFKALSSKIIINNSKAIIALKPKKQPEFDQSNGIAVSLEGGRFLLKGKPSGRTPQDSLLVLDEEILSINGRKAEEFEDKCQFLNWYVSQMPFEIQITKLDGTPLIFPKISFF
jgi:hypothetical protein